MKKLFLLLSLVFSSIVTTSYAETKLEDSYFMFDGQKQIEFSTGDVSANEIKLQDKSGKEYDAVVNVISSNKLAISPIEKISEPVKIKNKKNYTVSEYQKPMYVQTKENFDKIASYLEKDRFSPILYRTMDESASGANKLESTSKQAKKSAMSDGGDTNDYSKTNVQTKGIDEGDIVKTDGKYIYYVRNNSLTIASSDIKNLKQMAKISSKDEYFLRDVYVDDKILTLIYDTNKHSADMDKQITVVETYDITDIAKPQKIKSNEVNGYYMESRKKGNIMYVISSDYFRMSFMPVHNKKVVNGTTLRPFANYKYDSTGIDLTKMLYLPFTPSNEIINVSAISTRVSDKVNNLSYMGESGNIYMSNDNIYMTSNIYSWKNNKFSERTDIKKFAIKDSTFNYAGGNSFDGEIVNQFSLNEENGKLFVAYTKNRGEKNSENIIASYDKDMKKISELNNLAKGEKIYSARFMQGKVYLVTFKEVDPLFVIDIEKADDMKVLGYLKIPGYSNYLHPYKDGYLVGFGQKTKQKGVDTIVNDGFKISLFDVRDFSHPKEVDMKNIGDRGTYSSILNDHKSLMFDENRNIFVIPISVNKAEKKVYNGQETEDVKTSFIGAYAIGVSEKGFNIKAKISHYSDTAMTNLNDYDTYDYDKQIQRIVQINGKLYTLSEYGMKVSDMNNMKEIGFLKFDK